MLGLFPVMVILIFNGFFSIVLYRIIFRPNISFFETMFWKVQIYQIFIGTIIGGITPNMVTCTCILTLWVISCVKIYCYLSEILQKLKYSEWVESLTYILLQIFLKKVLYNEYSVDKISHTWCFGKLFFLISYILLW